MSKQYNKAEKRKRRNAYLKRKVKADKVKGSAKPRKTSPAPAAPAPTATAPAAGLAAN